jgi:FolB domain-containing protein
MAEQWLDRIHIRDLRLRCIIGLYPHERTERQDVVIQITLYVDLSLPGRTDRLEDSVDYKAVKQRVVAMVEGSSFLLLERLAEEIARLCLEDQRVRRVRVLVEKPGALRFARTVGVEIQREQ